MDREKKVFRPPPDSAGWKGEGIYREAILASRAAKRS